MYLAGGIKKKHDLFLLVREGGRTRLSTLQVTQVQAPLSANPSRTLCQHEYWQYFICPHSRISRGILFLFIDAANYVKLRLCPRYTTPSSYRVIDFISTTEVSLFEELGD